MINFKSLVLNNEDYKKRSGVFFSTTTLWGSIFFKKGDIGKKKTINLINKKINPKFNISVYLLNESEIVKDFELKTPRDPNALTELLIKNKNLNKFKYYLITYDSYSVVI